MPKTTAPCLCAAALMLAATACGTQAPPTEGASEATEAVAAFVWPASLKVMGDGYPKPGDACRRIGETAATVDFLDDSATLAGCPTTDDAARLGGKTVATIDGVTLVSVPAGSGTPGDGDGQGDAKVAGTAFNATAEIPCKGVSAKGPDCAAGVIRSPDQITVEVALPSGQPRVLLFDGKGKFVTVSTSEADGSAAYDISSKREGDWTVVTAGPEQYLVPDAFVLGD